MRDMESRDRSDASVGQHRVFATTRWSLVVSAGHRSSPDSQRALESLCEMYWYPLYAYVRRRVRDVNEAQDLTQAFFAELLEKNSVGIGTPERGRFRAYLLTAFKHFLSKDAIYLQESSYRVFSNFNSMNAAQSVWLLVLCLGATLFASAPRLAMPAKTILRVGSVIAAIVALVIQIQFYRSLGEFESGSAEKVVRSIRTYPQIGLYVTIALTGLAILFLALRFFDERFQPSSNMGNESKS